MPAYPVYMIYEGIASFLFSMVFTASSIYQVTLVGLAPLQLVLVGTTLESSLLLFEIPTGVVADAYSRRLSVIIGVILIGLGFIIEGSFPAFIPILAAQVVWGLGYTFTSGAVQAWLSDEIGEAAAGGAFLRANQLGNLAAILGIGACIAFGSLAINWPIQLGGIGMLLLGLFLVWRMPEKGMKQDEFSVNNRWMMFKEIFTGGLQMVNRRPMLMPILTIGLLFGLSSEGFDRLWTKHLLDQFALPFGQYYQPVVWLGVIDICALLAAIGCAEFVRRFNDPSNSRTTGRNIFLLSIGVIVGLCSFALANSFYLAVTAYIIVFISRSVISPLYTSWVNQRLDSKVRATVLSMSGQVDAIGQLQAVHWSVQSAIWSRFEQLY
jgi:MFS transporter, DHA3 family, tetracycline resistance protein